MGKRRGGKNRRRGGKSKKVPSLLDPSSSSSSSSKIAKHAVSSKGGRPRSKLSALQSKFKAKLEGAKFRWLNEQLYTTRGTEAFDMFQNDNSLFDIYHQGYKNQVESWPQNPLDLIIDFVKRRPRSDVVGDFGCGEARLAASVNQKVHSFDLVANPERGITACNIGSVPLKDKCLDMAVFCLSLMGTDYHKFVHEAHRVLKPGAILMVAEVKSRFVSDASSSPNSEKSGNNASKRSQMMRGISMFKKSMQMLGFDIKTEDASNQMFVLFRFVKSATREPAIVPASGAHQLKACRYKKR